MYTTLTEAPFGKPLKLIKVGNSNLYLRLQRMGLFQGSIITLHDEEIRIQPVRVKGTTGERVMGSGMASKVLVHLDDDRKFPMVEMKPGESGHIEGITGGSALAKALETLGFHNDDRVTMVRKLPPMEYIALTDKNIRISLTESMAAKVWGQSGETMMQLVSAPRGIKFFVKKLIGGRRIVKMFESKGVVTGSTIIPETVKQAQTLYMSKENPLVISSFNGLRLFLKREDGSHIFVQPVHDATPHP